MSWDHDSTERYPRGEPGGRGPGAGGTPPGHRDGRSRRDPRERLEPQIHARDLGRKGVITAFGRLQRVHLWSVGGDALFAVGLATTVFFNADPNAPRGKVFLYLFLTLAPFAVASPFIGPLLDRARGGRRWMIFGSALARALVAFLLIRDLENIGFYFEAFLMLVFSKVYLISKSAILPTTVRNDAELVEANSKLSMGGAVAGFAAGTLGFSGKLFGENGPKIALALAIVAFIVMAAQSFALPDVKIATDPEGEVERHELRGYGIRHAASAMALLRYLVGFITFLIAFSFREQGRPNWWFIVVVVFAQCGYLTGSALAPLLRRRLVEERMLMFAIGATFVAAALAFVLDGLVAAGIASFGVGMTSSIGKQGFDSLVQRDAPDANRGRSFAKFEAKFQMVWVLGAFVPVVIPIPDDYGFAFIALVAAYALGSYIYQFHQVQLVHAGEREPIPPKDPLWRRLYDRFRARRRAAKLASAGEEPVDATVPMPPYPPVEPPAEWAHTPPTSGLLGHPDSPMPSQLLAVPEAGLFAGTQPGASSLQGPPGAPARDRTVATDEPWADATVADPPWADGSWADGSGADPTVADPPAARQASTDDTVVDGSPPATPGAFTASDGFGAWDDTTVVAGAGAGGGGRGWGELPGAVDAGTAHPGAQPVDSFLDPDAYLHTAPQQQPSPAAGEVPDVAEWVDDLPEGPPVADDLPPVVIPVIEGWEHAEPRWNDDSEPHDEGRTPPLPPPPSPPSPPESSTPPPSPPPPSRPASPPPAPAGGTPSVPIAKPPRLPGFDDTDPNAVRPTRR